MDDLNEIANVEAECFPAAEAATKEEFAGRIRYYGNHFWIMLEEDKLIAFVDGFVTDEADLTDEMYEKAAMHNEDGAWQMIFGVNTLPDYRKHGYAGQLIQCAIKDAREQGRKGLVLTCKEKLIKYYAKFSFVDEGVSDKSTHGNAGKIRAVSIPFSCRYRAIPSASDHGSLLPCPPETMQTVSGFSFRYSTALSRRYLRTGLGPSFLTCAPSTII